MKHVKLVCVCLTGVFACTALGTAPESTGLGRIATNAGIRGGLSVVLGAGDAALLRDLAARGFVVQALDTDADRVADLRQLLRASGAYGRVSAEAFSGTQLPYVDNLVNLLVLPATESAPSDAEVVRVLAPRGVLVSKSVPGTSHLSFRQVGDWFIYRKPVPAAIDDWPMHMYEPGNNAVSRDRVVGPPDVLDETQLYGRFLQSAVVKKLQQQQDAVDGKQGGILWVVSAKDGTQLTEMKLSYTPVFDGLIAAREKLFMSTTDGRVICYQ